MKRLLVVGCVLAGLALPTTSGAAVPCRDRIYNDWYGDGQIASSYPVACYRDALKHVPADARIYSSLATDIRSAMRAAISANHGRAVPKQVGRGFEAVKATTSSPAAKGTGQLVTGPRAAASTTAQTATASASHAPPLGDAGNRSASGGIADTASSAPLPILVLGGIAIALAAAGAIGTGVRFARRRR